MEESGFDFSKYHVIDFNVDFKGWPLSAEAFAAIRHRYPDAVLRPAEDGDRGHGWRILVDAANRGE